MNQEACRSKLETLEQPADSLRPHLCRTTWTTRVMGVTAAAWVTFALAQMIAVTFTAVAAEMPAKEQSAKVVVATARYGSNVGLFVSYVVPTRSSDARVRSLQLIPFEKRRHMSGPACGNRQINRSALPVTLPLPALRSCHAVGCTRGAWRRLRKVAIPLLEKS